MSSSQSKKLQPLVFVGIAGIIFILAVYLMMPADIYREPNNSTAGNNYSREDFYTEYLAMVEEQKAGLVDQTADTLSQSVINNSTLSTSGVRYQWDSQLSQIDNVYTGYSGNFKQLDVGNSFVYLQEQQSKKYWGSCKADNGSSIKLNYDTSI